MRLLIPLLLVAGLGAGFLVLRRSAATGPAGTGPEGGSATTADGTRPAIDLAASESSPRAPAANVPTGDAAGTTTAAALEAAAVAAGADAIPAKEPEFAGGVTTDPVSTELRGTAGFYADKYRNASRATRVQSFEALRVTVDLELQREGKDSTEIAAEMKREMEWLQDNLDG